MNTESVEVNQAKHVKFFDFEKVHIMASSIIERDSLVSSWELVDSSQIYFKVGSEYLGYPNPIHFAS
ncbi:MAG: hypothetical protein GWN01_13165, partial [Nitrosopumilaceae archaeon]|nr:hypothetical protein [Nitrosopumilaceae archaeon]NIU87013.1 hypothetical protein [Nitrosopumilaceae archaeon]NIX62416.1 hypothetical protein [Nitrosopumilaceae archaeon]